jgi:uncharacterized pyridoxamine 5'-phosphate oxidase family protein
MLEDIQKSLSSAKDDAAKQAVADKIAILMDFQEKLFRSMEMLPEITMCMDVEKDATLMPILEAAHVLDNQALKKRVFQRCAFLYERQLVMKMAMEYDSTLEMMLSEMFLEEEEFQKRLNKLVQRSFDQVLLTYSPFQNTFAKYLEESVSDMKEEKEYMDLQKSLATYSKESMKVALGLLAEDQVWAFHLIKEASK